MLGVPPARCARLVSCLTSSARVCDSVQTVLLLQTTAHLAGSSSKFHPTPAIDALVRHSSATAARTNRIVHAHHRAPTCGRRATRTPALRRWASCTSILRRCPGATGAGPGNAVDFALEGGLTCTLRLRLSCGAAVRLEPGPEVGEAQCLAPAKAGTLLLVDTALPWPSLACFASGAVAFSGGASVKEGPGSASL
ncbi:hypothetical protein OH76DRAFT_193829 [Lentinus brumalis]|uniref:Uncharacterized protein n=1 Tax=Lentinus brumalis TaxID=2498619 RepID=A0A371DHW7_9APHY|nr:hypothetical protein OH76DRAFT_193829 [Polyporus brumalis]